MVEPGTVESILEELRRDHTISGNLAPLHASVQANLGPLLGSAPKWSLIGSTVESGLYSVLALPLSDVLAGAWSTLRELREFRGPTGGRGHVALAHHTVEASYRPTLTINVSSPAIWSQSFDLDLKLRVELEALTLNIDGGKIRAFSPSAFRLTVGLEWNKCELLRVLNAGPFDLLGHVRLGDGITIP